MLSSPDTPPSANRPKAFAWKYSIIFEEVFRLMRKSRFSATFGGMFEPGFAICGPIAKGQKSRAQRAIAILWLALSCDAGIGDA